MHSPVKVWAKRFFIYFLGLFVMSLGVALSARSDLGVSPVTGLANVVSVITGVSLGFCTTCVYLLYILIEFLILRRDFKPVMVLQIAVSTIFGLFVNLSVEIVGLLPTPESYGMKFLYMLCSIPIVSLGVMLYLTPEILSTPGDGTSIAIAKKGHLSIAVGKLIFDCSCVAVSAIASLIWFHALVGVREGTLLAALAVGTVMNLWAKLLKPVLSRFVEREPPAARSPQAAA